MQALTPVAFLQGGREILADADHPSGAERLAARQFKRFVERRGDVAAWHVLRVDLGIVMPQFERLRVRFAAHLRHVLERQVASWDRYADAHAAQTRRLVGKAYFHVVALSDRASGSRGCLLEPFQRRFVIAHRGVPGRLG